jgi:hypothetical protein
MVADEIRLRPFGRIDVDEGLHKDEIYRQDIRPTVAAATEVAKINSRKQRVHLALIHFVDIQDPILISASLRIDRGSHCRSFLSGASFFLRPGITITLFLY